MADNITHGLAAALLAQAGLRQRYGALATAALLVGSELPDLDTLFELGGPVYGFVHYRGTTHSLLGGIWTRAAWRHASVERVALPALLARDVAGVSRGAPAQLGQAVQDGVGSLGGPRGEGLGKGGFEKAGGGFPASGSSADVARGYTSPLPSQVPVTCSPLYRDGSRRGEGPFARTYAYEP
jgi:hypothetical protein